MKIKTKMIAGFCGLLLLILGVGGAGLGLSYKEAKQIEKIQRIDYPIDSACRQLKFDIVQIQQFLTDASLTGNTDGYKEAQKSKEDADNMINKLKSHYA
ncbi:hypothetical protein MCHI_002376, partial [Candidatus Magnetoovum chiemensis]